MVMLRACLLILCLAGTGAKRVDVNEHVDMQGNATVDMSDEFVELESQWDEEDALVELEEESADAGDGESYWSHKGEWRMLGLVDESNGHKYKLKEDQRFIQTKKYKVKRDDDTKDGSRPSHKQVLEVENYFWTMRGHQEIRIDSESGVDAYLMFHPRYINRHWTWRITKKSDPSTILFTIQKRLWNDHCKILNMWKCKTVLKIYVGNRGDKSTLIYYGVGDAKDLDEPDFKFYHSEDAYKADKHQYVAKIDHKKEKSKKFKGDEDEFKVWIGPGEDTALLLAAGVCLDRVADAVQAMDDDD